MPGINLTTGIVESVLTTLHDGINKVSIPTQEKYHAQNTLWQTYMKTSLGENIHKDLKVNYHHHERSIIKSQKSSKFTNKSYQIFGTNLTGPDQYI